MDIEIGGRLRQLNLHFGRNRHRRISSAARQYSQHWRIGQFHRTRRRQASDRAFQTKGTRWIMAGTNDFRIQRRRGVNEAFRETIQRAIITGHFRRHYVTIRFAVGRRV